MDDTYQKDLVGRKMKKQQPRPHLDKLKAALKNEKCTGKNREVVKNIKKRYFEFIDNLEYLNTSGKVRVDKMTELLNDYKNYVANSIVEEEEAEFLRRQKGQLKIESSITEEFLVQLMNPYVIPEVKSVEFVLGPQETLLSLSFTPRDFSQLSGKPSISIERKDQDFAIGTNVFYKFSTSKRFSESKMKEGEFTLPVLAVECKRHLDKTMYREAVGTASQIKNYISFSRYYIITDFLDMSPQNPKVTALDNVYILRKAKRLPQGERKDPDIVSKHLENHPVEKDVVWNLVQEIRDFLSTTWYDPSEALDRGSFV